MSKHSKPPKPPQTMADQLKALATQALAEKKSAQIQTSQETNASDETSSSNLTPPPMQVPEIHQLADRFRKFLPVVVDVETAGFDAQKDALLEIACIPILMDEAGKFYQGEAVNAHIEPFKGANLDPRALEFTGIDVHNPMRKLISEDEKTALRRIFKHLKGIRKEQNCRQCVLIGHNAHFDLSFLNAAIERTNSKSQSPFHQFSVLDTVTLSALAFGQTVLARACQAAGIEFSGKEAHSALYDTQKTAELFCHILNHYPMLPNAIVALAEETTETTDTLTNTLTDTPIE